MTFEQAFTLNVPSTTQNLALIRDFVNRISSQAGFDADEMAKLELAVDEACANVIEHAYEGEEGKQVMVNASFDDEVLRITVVDTGKGFDPSGVHQANLRELAEKRRTGGLGMRLIQSLMDEVHYEIGPGNKNELQMVKRLRKP
ncbi:MAG TPA: ATP-binding protein [Thermoanaerobaculia bacterium]|nr:ATP-binding protein [Thermoanaerobaculia bacterium]